MHVFFTPLFFLHKLVKLLNARYTPKSDWQLVKVHMLTFVVHYTLLCSHHDKVKRRFARQTCYVSCKTYAACKTKEEDRTLRFTCAEIVAQHVLIVHCPNSADRLQAKEQSVNTLSGVAYNAMYNAEGLIVDRYEGVQKFDKLMEVAPRVLEKLLG